MDLIRGLADGARRGRHRRRCRGHRASRGGEVQSFGAATIAAGHSSLLLDRYR